jgi:hypothetical protein
VSHARDSSVSDAPVTISRRSPKRSISTREAACEARNSIAVRGRKASPARIGLRPGVFIDYAATKKHILHEVIEATGRDSELMTHSRATMTAAAEKIVRAAQESGDIRTDVNAPDVIRLVGGCTMMPNFDRAQLHRILSVVIDGLRAG